MNKASGCEHKNFEPMVVTNRIGTPKHYVVDGVTVECYESLNTGFRLGIPYSIPTVTSFPTFLKAVKSSKIIHAHGHPYLTSLTAGKLAKLYNKPFVLTQHNTFIEYNNIFDNVERLNDLTVGKQNLKSADKIIAISNATKEYVLRLGAKPSKVKVIYNGVDLARFRPIAGKREEMRKKLGIPQNAIVVLTVRRLVYKNGVDTLIDCANIAVKKNPRIVFLAVGKGPDSESVKLQDCSSWELKIILSSQALSAMKIYLLTTMLRTCLCCLQSRVKVCLWLRLKPWHVHCQ